MKQKPLEIQLHHQFSEMLKTLKSFEEDGKRIEAIFYSDDEGNIQVNEVSACGFEAEGIADGNLKDAVRHMTEHYKLE